MRIKSLFFLALLSLLPLGNLFAQVSAWKTYQNKELGISFSYPADFKVSMRDATGDESNPNGVIVEISPIRIPDKFRGGYWFEVIRSDRPEKICGAGNDGYEQEDEPPKWPKTRILGGSDIYLFAGSDAGMGQYHSTYGYRGTVNKSCWQIISIEEGATMPEKFQEHKKLALDRKIIQRSYLQLLDSFQFIKP